MKKYALHPGEVLSQHDWDVHFIGADALARLYGVPIRDCIVVPPGHHGWVDSRMIHLYPDYTGKYELPGGVTMNTGLKVGDEVEWSSQAGGHETTKRGTIILVVPEKTHVTDVKGFDKLLSSHNRDALDGGTIRTHESYLVSVEPTSKKAKPRLYWPLVKKLRVAMPVA